MWRELKHISCILHEATQNSIHKYSVMWADQMSSSEFTGDAYCMHQ